VIIQKSGCFCLTNCLCLGANACCTQGSLVSYVCAQVVQLFGLFWFSFRFVSTQEHSSFTNAGFMLDLRTKTVPSASSTRNGSTVTKRASNAHLRGGSCICTSISRGSGIGVNCGLSKSKAVLILCVFLPVLWFCCLNTLYW